MGRRNKWLMTAVLVPVALALLVWQQGKNFIEAQLKADLARRGITQLDFHVSAISTNGITLSDIRFGSGLTLDSLTVDYHLLELLRGAVRTIHTGELIFTQDQTRVEVKSLEASITKTEGGVGGSWLAHEIKAKNLPIELPVLEGRGNFDWRNDYSWLGGHVGSADDSYAATFTLRYLSDNGKTRLSVQSATVPWSGGHVQVRNLTVPLYGTQPVTVPLQLQHLSLDALVQSATGKRASATGTVSGTVPVILEKHGDFILGDGSLRAEGAGVLRLPPDVIPGGNEQVDLLRQLLADFHYSALSLEIGGGKDNGLSMLLSLSGNNPAVYNGRQVNLKVKLGGDVLAFVRQSLSLNNPRKLMERTQ